MKNINSRDIEELRKISLLKYTNSSPNIHPLTNLRKTIIYFVIPKMQPIWLSRISQTLEKMYQGWRGPYEP